MFQIFCLSLLKGYNEEYPSTMRLHDHAPSLVEGKENTSLSRRYMCRITQNYHKHIEIGYGHYILYYSCKLLGQIWGEIFTLAYNS